LIKIIDRYIFRSLWPPFLAGFFGTMVIVTFGNTLRAIRLLAEGKVDRADILWWYVYRIPEDIQYVFPVATMLATLLVFGQLSKQSEITALRAAGVNPARLSAPVLVFALIHCFLLFHFLDDIVPRWMAKSQSIWEDKIRVNRAVNAFKERLLMRDRDRRLIFVGRYDLRTSEMRSVMVREYDEVTHALTRQITAPIGRYMCGTASENSSPRSPDSDHASTCKTRNHWTLEDVTVQIARPQGPWLIRKKQYRVELGEGPEDFAREDRSPVEMTGSELLAEIRRLDERGLADTVNLKVELYLKSSFPVCVLIFCIIGGVMGFTSNRGGGAIGFGVSLLTTFLYYISMSLSTSLGKTGVLHPMFAAWLHNFIFMGVAIFFIFRVQTR